MGKRPPEPAPADDGTRPEPAESPLGNFVAALTGAPAHQNPLAVPAVLNPTGAARDFALAAAELLKSGPGMLHQSRTQAIRLLNVAIALIAT